MQGEYRDLTCQKLLFDTHHQCVSIYGVIGWYISFKNRESEFLSKWQQMLIRRGDWNSTQATQADGRGRLEFDLSQSTLDPPIDSLVPSP